MGRRLSMGKTTFRCRDCQAVTVVENLDLEVMEKFRCPGCGIPMPETQMALLKIQYFTKIYAALSAPPFCGRKLKPFDVQMDFDPHYEVME